MLEVEVADLAEISLVINVSAKNTFIFEVYPKYLD